ncbi:uncharacterized protein [Mobula birostris]|uniref:uncharacterized protein isoform X1 n=1 Tax=Mobula birostris TaxID=1983395 RepID=UPI003B282E59
MKNHQRCSSSDFTSGANNTLINSLENQACFINIECMRMMLHIHDLRCSSDFTSGANNTLIKSLENKACLINIECMRMMLHIHDIRCSSSDFTSGANNTLIKSLENKACLINIECMRMMLHIHDIRCFPPYFTSRAPYSLSILLEEKASLINIDGIQMMLHIHDLSLIQNSNEPVQLQELVDILFSGELFFKHQASNCNGRCLPPNFTSGAPNTLIISLENKARLINIDGIQMMLHIHDLRYELESVLLDSQDLGHMTRLVNTGEDFRLDDGGKRILLDRVISAAQLKYNSIPMVVYRLVPSVDTMQQNNSLSVWDGIQENRNKNDKKRGNNNENIKDNNTSNNK